MDFTTATDFFEPFAHIHQPVQARARLAIQIAAAKPKSRLKLK